MTKLHNPVHRSWEMRRQSILRQKPLEVITRLSLCLIDNAVDKDWSHWGNQEKRNGNHNNLTHTLLSILNSNWFLVWSAGLMPLPIIWTSEEEGLRRGVVVGFCPSWTEVPVGRWFHCVVFRPAGSTSPGKVVKIQSLRPHPKSTWL